MDQALSIQKNLKENPQDYEVRFNSGYTYEHIDFNLDHPILKSKNMRKALTLAADRETMIKALFENKQEIAAHFLSPLDPWFKNLPAHLRKPTEFKRKQAEALLEAEGWKLNEDGYRYKNNQKLSLVFSTTAGNKLRETVQGYLLDQWKKVGVDVVIKNTPARVFFGDLMKNRKFEGMAMFAWTFMPELTPTKFYSSASIPNEQNGWSGRNYVGFKDNLLDKVLAENEIELNPKKRQKNMNKIVEIYKDNFLTMPLYYRADINIVPKKLSQFNPTGTQQSETLYIENWTF
jgi:peptide/nickel transport system substrate-binding protein